MKIYYVNESELDNFASAVRSSQAELDLDSLDEAVRPFAKRITESEHTGRAVEVYTCILDDLGIEFPSDSLTEALDEACQGACIWYPFPSARASAFAARLGKVGITPKNAAPFIGPREEDSREIQSLRGIHSELKELLSSVGSSEIALLRVDL